MNVYILMSASGRVMGRYTDKDEANAALAEVQLRPKQRNARIMTIEGVRHLPAEPCRDTDGAWGGGFADNH